MIKMIFRHLFPFGRTTLFCFEKNYYGTDNNLIYNEQQEFMFMLCTLFHVTKLFYINKQMSRRQDFWIVIRHHIINHPPIVKHTQFSPLYFLGIISSEVFCLEWCRPCIVFTGKNQSDVNANICLLLCSTATHFHAMQLHTAE